MAVGPETNSQSQRKKDTLERFTPLNRVPFGKFYRVNLDGILKSPSPVTPAKAGVQNLLN